MIDAPHWCAPSICNDSYEVKKKEDNFISTLANVVQITNSTVQGLLQNVGISSADQETSYSDV
jgi:hypothetical protein